MAEWHIITCEYPPQLGGVSDYTYLLSSALAAAGDSVHVWCPTGSGDPTPAPGVVVHRELGRFNPGDFHRVGKKLNEFSAPRRLTTTPDRKSTRLNSSHANISYAVFC